MKKYLVLLAVLFVLQPTTSIAEDGSSFAERVKGMYFGINAGWTKPHGFKSGSAQGQTWDSHFDPGLALRAVVGYAVPNENLRSEFEIAWQKSDPDFNFYRISDRAWLGKLDEGHLTALAFMVNAYYDFKNRTPFTPFIGGGVGYGKNEYTIKQPDGSDWMHDSSWDIALQAGGGVSYAVTDHISLEVKYLYYWPKSKWDNHIVLGGLRYTF